MITLVHNRNKSKDDSISFPILQCWNPETRVATIVAQVSGRRISCRIKAEDLCRKFDNTPDDPMGSVTRNRGAIEDAARKLIDGKCFEDDGSITIGYQDL